MEASNIQNARGVGRHTPLRERGIGDQSEKEVFSFIVGEKEADDAFEFVFHEAHIDEPHGGIVYMCDITAATPFMLPELSERLNSGSCLRLMTAWCPQVQGTRQ